MWLRLLELLAHLYHYTLDYCLYRLTLAQALSLIDLYNARERKAREASEDAERSDDVGYVCICQSETGSPAFLVNGGTVTARALAGGANRALLVHSRCA